MQFQSDITNVEVERPQNLESTALGAAHLAGLAVKFYKDTKTVAKDVKRQALFRPNMSEAERKRKLRNWRKAVKCAMGWSDKK